MNLTDLRPAEGSTKRRKRVGRGIASGHGKTCNRGNNGQGQRSGEARRFGFEGGQTPLFRRLPKLHNFDSVPGRKWVFVNVGDFNSFAANSEVTPGSLFDNKLLDKETKNLRVLGNGELKVALKVKAHHISAGAKAKIEAAGGSVEIIPSEPKSSKKR